MKLLALDFETKDPYIDLKMGAGWVYKLHVPTSLFKTIGYSYTVYSPFSDPERSPRYAATDEQGIELLTKLIGEADGILAHNAQYELGCLLTLGIDISNLDVMDTKVMASLYDSNVLSTSLDNLSKIYLHANCQKGADLLVDTVIAKNLAPGLKPKSKTYVESRYRAKVKKWTYSNMDVIQEADFDTMAIYCNQDVTATIALADFYLKNGVTLKDAMYWSKFQRHCVFLRKRGIAVDITACKAGIAEMEPEVARLEKNLEKELGCSVSSPKQLAAALLARNYKLGTSAGGGPSTNKKWLDAQVLKGDELCIAIKHYRTSKKLLNDFFVKILEMQQYTCPDALAEGATRGRVYPEMNLFGARTGRFSSSNPNIQQIPKRDPVWGARIRSIFVPDSTQDTWYSLDWSNQEGRLQVHYAAVVGASEADAVVEEFRLNPELDLHQKVADLAGITRSQAKPLNLGISYGMGEAKLCASLGLPTKYKTIRGQTREVAGKEGKAILLAYHNGAPFIKELISECTSVMETRGYIKTIAGRVQRADPGRTYTAISKLIQGSAADQCLVAFDMAMEAGIDVICMVHDEFNIQGTLEDALKMQTIMQTCIPMKVPAIAGITAGSSWGTQHDLEKTDEL